MLLKPLLKPLTGAVPLAQYPLTLFASGEQGIWLDPSDLSTLFQDAAGTMPVALDGDPVGLVLDKSGNGNHASQSISASRPTYRTDGILHWLEFDGVDDYLVSGVIDFSEFSSMSYSIGFYKKTNAPTQIPLSFGDPGGQFGTWYLAAPGGGGLNAYRSLARGTIVSEAQVGQLDDAPSRSVVTATMEISSDTNVLRRNGGVIASSSGDLGVGKFGAHTAAVGCLANGLFPAENDIYSVIIRERVLTINEIDVIERYAAKKSGVTL